MKCLRFGLAWLSALSSLALIGCQGLRPVPASQPPGPPAPLSLSVAMAGTGTGTITSSPTGINCPATCSATFPQNTPVTLNETPATGSVFTSWSGGCTGTTTCSVALSAATTSVTATFTLGGSLQSVNHIIVFVQENRSFDHYFGALRAYWAQNGIPDQSFDGLPQFNPATGAAPLLGPVPTVPGCDPTNPDGTTVCAPDPIVLVPSFHMASVCTEELSPFWNEAHVDWNYADPTGATPALNGFVIAGANDARQYPSGPVNDVNGYRTMGYFDSSDLNYYYFMASSFATSDRWFAPVMSRTQLNRMYLLAATSAGHAYPLTGGPLSNQTIFQALQNAGITWKIYVNSAATGCADTDSSCLINNSYINMFTYFSTIMNTPSLLQNIVSVNQFKTDVANGTLPQVALIEPASNASLDEHPTDIDTAGGVNIQAGAAYASSLMNALMNSPSWKDSVMIFTYDEPGGFYDHVAPQPAAVPDSFAFPFDLVTGDECDGVNATSGICSFGMTGYRVPMFVVSPFSKKNFVSHTTYDHTAILKLIETRFGIAALTARDAAQADMSTDFFDFTNVPWATPPTPPGQSRAGQCSLAAPVPPAP